MDREIDAILSAVMHGPVGQRLLLFDFDGTLREFTGIPTDANLPAHRRQLLVDLEQRPDAVVGIVSGRRIADVRERAGVDGLIYSGLHGLEIETSRLTFQHEGADSAQAMIPDLARRLARAIDGLAGVLIENKRLSLVVHWRMAGPIVREEARRRLAETLEEPLRTGFFKLQPGNDMCELLPNVSWNKGDAVRWICNQVAREHGRDCWPLFVGDDATDEDAFRAIAANGVTVVVGHRSTAANYRLPDPAAVEKLLQRLVRAPSLLAQPVQKA